MGARDPRLSTRAAILETAAHMLAERGDTTVAEIAAATGVGRATLYRHYPSREALLDALAREAIEELVRRLDDARPDRTDVPDALERLLRAFLSVGDRYIVLVRERILPDSVELEERLGEPIRALIARGVADGTIRSDLDVDLLARLFGSLVLGGLEAGLQSAVGIDEAARTLASVFLEGVSVRTRPAATL